jgi:hypothetical protein
MQGFAPTHVLAWAATPTLAAKQISTAIANFPTGFALIYLRA